MKILLITLSLLWSNMILAASGCGKHQKYCKALDKCVPKCNLKKCKYGVVDVRKNYQCKDYVCPMGNDGPYAGASSVSCESLTCEYKWEDKDMTLTSHAYVNDPCQ